jgi:hypothetical protein
MEHGGHGFDASGRSALAGLESGSAVDAGSLDEGPERAMEHLGREVVLAAFSS